MKQETPLDTMINEFHMKVNLILKKSEEQCKILIEQMLTGLKMLEKSVFTHEPDESEEGGILNCSTFWESITN